MGRHAAGWKIKWRDGNRTVAPGEGWASVRFTHGGREFVIALGTRDPAEAARRAAREYAETVSGRRVVVAGSSAAVELDVLLALCIDDQQGALDIETRKTLVIYARRFAAYFETLDRITTASIDDYSRARLQQVTKSTVRKERWGLGLFLEWCVAKRHLADAPPMKPLPRKSTGVRSGRQRARSVYVTPDEAQAILDALPEESKLIAGRRWPIRARFVFAYWTGLRPSTVSALEVPRHWRRGATTVVIDDEDDKARFGRTIDLPAPALAALMSVAPEEGLVFGPTRFRDTLKRAAREVLGEVRAKGFAPYDFRHGRGKHLVDAGAPLRGVAYVLGHKLLSTTDKYLEPDREEGRRAIAAIPGQFPDNRGRR